MACKHNDMEALEKMLEEHIRQFDKLSDGVFLDYETSVMFISASETMLRMSLELLAQHLGNMHIKQPLTEDDAKRYRQAIERMLKKNIDLDMDHFITYLKGYVQHRKRKQSMH